MIGLSENAANKVRELLLSDPKRLGLRPAVKGGGCSGFQYVLDFVHEPSKNDKKVESRGIMLFVDPKSYLYLMGTEIDYVDDLQSSGFKFQNPNARRTCGCGESFSV